MTFKERLAGIFGSNAVKKALIWLIVVSVGTLIVVTQFAFPVLTFYKSTKTYTYKDKDFSTYISDVYNRITNAQTEQGNTVTVSDKTFDMSESPENYMRICISFDFWNIGVYNINNIQFSITPSGKHKDRFVFKEGNVALIKRFSNSEINLIFVMYTKDMTSEDINNAISSLEIKYSFDRPELFASGGEIKFSENDTSSRLNDIKNT